MRTLFLVLLIILVTVAGARSRRAFLEIILYEVNQNDGRYTMRRIGITGEYSNAGTASTAEGDIIQMHPHRLCEDFEDDLNYDYGWVGVVKLSYHGADPCHLVEKAQRAVGQGATAVIFDVSDHPDAPRQLNENSFNQPIVLVKGMDATELMKIIKGEQIARAVIKQGEPDQEGLGSRFTDPALLVTCILVVFLVLCIGISKVKWRRQRQQASLRNWTVRHSITRKYKKQRQLYDAVPQSSVEWKKNSGASDTSSAILCAICLESFQDGQDLRVLECQHEFHVDCIDIWLKQKRSCPLCNRSFSNLPAKTRTPPLHHSEGSTNGQGSVRHEMAGLLVQNEVEQNGQNSVDEYESVVSYGAIQRQQNENLLFRPPISNSCEENGSCSDHSISTDKSTHFCIRLRCDLCALENQNSTSFDHKDSVHRCHRKRNQRGPTDWVETFDTGTNSASGPGPKRNNYSRPSDYLHENRERDHNSNDANEDTDSCTEESGSCNEKCDCRINGASETSIWALHGSLSFAESSYSSFFSPFSNTSKCVEYSSDPPRISDSEFSGQCLARSRTPCIEYSSSDGASNLVWLSYSTLEDVLGVIDSGTSGQSS